ncbi:SWIM zinc finger family protein [Chloroflexota bacterium]
MNPSKPDIFKKLTWADIQEWAGTAVVSRGKSYHRSHRVQELALTASGGVIAWVLGTQRYATSIDIEGGELTSACTCPYDGTCKHTVAVVLEYLESLKQEIEVSTVPETDQRLALLGQPAEQGAGQGEETIEGKENATPVFGQQSTRVVPGAVHSYLEQQTRAQLIVLLEEMAQRHPAVRQSLQDRADLSKGTVTRMVEAVRKEIDTISAQPGWTNSWNSEGYVPDYSGVQDRLKALLAKGHADEVIALGEQLLEAGTRQVEMGHDEGETAEEIARCLDVVFQALTQSSLSPVDQMLWAVQAELNDEYDLCQGAAVFWEQEFGATDWSTLADRLEQLLDQQRANKGDGNSSRNYHRDCLSDWVIEALEEAGRQEEIIPLCEREAKRTGSYVRLVNHLIEANRKEEAEQWIHEGIGVVQKDWPGISDRLRAILRQMREEENDWPQVAAIRAGDFFALASLETFKELQEAAERAGAWPEVRAAAMHYLETGELPQNIKQSSEKATILSWPLPQTGVEEKVEVRHMDFPMIGTLIDIAIADKRPEEVIRWYDRRQPGSAGLGRMWWTWFQEDKIAEAVADAYPDRAMNIWKKLAESQIAQTQPKAYEVAAGFLRNMCRTYKKLGRDSEWLSYLAQLRSANARKRKLLEILDSLTERRIINGR